MLKESTILNLSYVTGLPLVNRDECGAVYGDNINYEGLLCIDVVNSHGTCNVSESGEKKKIQKKTNPYTSKMKFILSSTLKLQRRLVIVL